MQKSDPHSVAEANVEQDSHDASPYMNGYRESPEETDSSEEMNMVPRKLQFSSSTPSSKYTKQEDIVC